MPTRPPQGSRKGNEKQVTTAKTNVKESASWAGTKLIFQTRRTCSQCLILNSKQREAISNAWLSACRTTTAEKTAASDQQRTEDNQHKTVQQYLFELVYYREIQAAEGWPLTHKARDRRRTLSSCMCRCVRICICA